jgi:hypothetical protein
MMKLLFRIETNECVFEQWGEYVEGLGEKDEE